MTHQTDIFLRLLGILLGLVVAQLLVPGRPHGHVMNTLHTHEQVVNTLHTHRHVMNTLHTHGHVVNTLHTHGHVNTLHTNTDMLYIHCIHMDML